MSSGDDEIDAVEVEDSLSYIDEAQGYGSSFGERSMLILSGAVAFIFGAITAPIEALVNLVVGLIGAFTDGGVAWIGAFTTEPAQYISTSFETGAAGFSNTAFSELGPFLPWLGTIVAIGVVFIVTWYLDRRDSDVVGLGVDLPVIGNEDDGDVSDEID
mgnify:CR=1 FL=1